MGHEGVQPRNVQAIPQCRLLQLHMRQMIGDVNFAGILDYRPIQLKSTSGANDKVYVLCAY